MSTRINLLPWREAIAKQKQQEFGLVLGLAAVVGIALVAIWYFYNVVLLGAQESRVKHLDGAIVIQDEKIEEIQSLEKKRADLVSRMNAIETLQKDRPNTVRFFDELQTTIPDGVSLNFLEQTTKKVAIQGEAESNARVSNFMRKLDSSEWLGGPKLEIIEKSGKDNTTTKGISFKLLFNQITPKSQNTQQEEISDEPPPAL